MSRNQWPTTGTMTFINWLSSLARSQPTRANLTQAQVLTDPHYRFKSLAEVELAAALGVRIDVNQASVDDWLRLPGISIHQARLLVQLTQAGVQFHCLEDIAAVLRSPLQRLQPLESVLQFCFYDPESTHAVKQVNPNTAALEALGEADRPARYDRVQSARPEQLAAAYPNRCRMTALPSPSIGVSP